MREETCMRKVIKVRASVLAWRPCVNDVFCHLSQLLHFRKGKDRERQTERKISHISVFHIYIMHTDSFSIIHNHITYRKPIAETLCCKTCLLISMHISTK